MSRFIRNGIDDDPGSNLNSWGQILSDMAPRIPGTILADRARDFICDTLNGFGLETWLEPIRFRGVFFDDWRLTISGKDDRQLVCFPQNNVGFGSVQAPVTEVGDGRPDDYAGKDVAGKIVLVNWGNLSRHELACGLRKRYPLLATYDEAWKRGAAGMIGYFTDTPGNSLKLLEPGIRPSGGSNIPGPAETGENRQILLPVLTIGKEDALRLKHAMNRHPVTATHHISGVRKVSTVFTVMARLNGLSDHAVMVGSHYCTAFTGAICDTVGVVGALEMARYYAALPRSRRPKTLIFMFSGSHVWINCNAASLHVIDRYPDLIKNLTAMLWMDHISAPAIAHSDHRGREHRITLTSGNPLLYAMTLKAMRKNRRLPLVFPLSRIWTLCEMGPFDRLGIPAMSMQAITDDLLTTEDTWEKIDPEILYEDVGVYMDLCDSIQHVPGKWLRYAEIPGRSFFGCGSLFSDLSMPDYPEGEVYVPEAAQALYTGGVDGPVRTVPSVLKKY